MKKNRLLTIWLLCACGLLLFSSRAYATHGQAGQLTYTSLGNNQYQVTCSFFRDCSGRTIPSTLSLDCQRACNQSSVSATLRPIGQSTIGQPYCAGTQGGNVCSANPGALPNYETLVYQGSVTLPPAPEWIMSVEIDARPYTATLVNSNQKYLRLEARLYSQITLPGGATQNIVNNSPVFSNTNSPVPFVCWQQQSTLSFTATDTDRLNNGRADSLVYSLEQPWHTCGTVSVYVSYPAPACSPTTGACPISCPTGPANYTPTLPILVKMDTVGTCPNRRVVPSFYFNAQAGSFTFTPSRFVLNGANNDQDNKYVVVGMVTEYRKIGGRYYKVGSVRRDFLVIVIDCGGNKLPASPVGTVADTLAHTAVINRRDTTQLTVYTCNYARIALNFTDPNNVLGQPQQNLTVFFPTDINTNLLQGVGSFSLSRNGTPNPKGTFLFQATPGQANTQVLVNLRIEDDACPIKGVQYRTLVINVKPGSFARAVASAGAAGIGGQRPPAICRGGSLVLNAAVSRPDSVLLPGGLRPVVQVYSYQWSALNNSGLDPNQTRGTSLAVRPLANTRYRLSIIPTLGFGANGGGCGDTTSLLVRVVPPPTARASATPGTACAAASVVLAGAASRNDNLNDSYTYTWTGGNLPANTTGQTVTTRPVAAVTRYKLTVTGNAQYGCRDTTSVVVRLAPTPTVAFKTDSLYGGNASRPLPPVTYKFTNQSTIGGGFALDSVRWTYQRVKDGNGATVTAPETRFSSRRDTTSLRLTNGGLYVIRLYANPVAGGAACSATLAARAVRVPTITVPNVITPNGDKLNDKFVVSGELVGGKLQVFNRWGRLVAELSNYQNSWDGTGQPAGTYYFRLTTGQGQEAKGWLEVIK
jgi:gliding motility-associated-like protein